MDTQLPAACGYAEETQSNASQNPYFGDILQARLSRRKALMGGLSATTAAMFSSTALVGCDDDNGAAGEPKLGFSAVPKGQEDLVALPAGYAASVLYALGDPIAEGVSAYGNLGTDGDFDRRAGDHHDGMRYYGLDASGRYAPAASDRGLLCINHENITQTYLHATGPTQVNGVRPEAEVRREMNAHGVAVIEVSKASGTWQVVQDSPFNRRITPFSPIELKGPLQGSSFARTRFSGDGTRTRGTINNCAHGYTPWGTHLTCEENWAFYFRRDAGDDANRSAEENALLSRYGINPGNAGNYGWTSVSGDEFERLNITVSGASAGDDYRNEAFTYGYIVEIDPFDPEAVPRKRTALGRLGHEGCWPAPARAGRPVVFYTGDDSRFEYIYKFVSTANWDPADAEGGLAAGDKYMDAGTLYVARFNADGTGQWLELGNSVDVCVGTRLAADAAGATKMDRPEWGAVNPFTGEVYMTLTNNTRRTADGSTDAANPRNYDAGTDGDADLDGNVNGHIIRWREDGDDAAATTFTWDIYAFGARASAPATVNVSGLTADNDFSSPDGLWFDGRGILWIQTDDGAYTDVTNCMMLAAVPGAVGDGAAVDIGTQNTFVGLPPTPATLRRFLVGCRECEITGVDITPDYRTMFVNIQHPGEDGSFDAPSSNWPSSSRDATVVGEAGSRPRSATIVITRNDGGRIGT